MPTTPKKMGRPSDFTQEKADKICTGLSIGKPLTTILRDDPDLPEHATVYRWIAANADFRDQYARAREEQADTNADEIVTIADEAPEFQPVYDKDGNVVELKIDAAYVAYQKQRIEARKWTAMKLKPKKYGDKIAVGGDEGNPVQVKSPIFDELLATMLLKRQTE